MKKLMLVFALAAPGCGQDAVDDHRSPSVQPIEDRCSDVRAELDAQKARNAELEKSAAELEKLASEKELKIAALSSRTDELTQQLDEEKNGPKRLLAKAKSRFDSGEFSIAIQVADSLIESRPESAEAAEAKQLKSMAAEKLKEQVAKAEAERAKLEKKLAKERRAALKSMKSSKDEFKGITWYKDKSTSIYGDQLYLYFGVKDGKPITLRLVVAIESSSWVFADSFSIKADDNVYKYDNIGFSRDSYTKIWETADEALSPGMAAAIHAMFRAKDVKVRVQGRRGYEDFKMSKRKLDAIMRVIRSYKAMGGTLDSTLAQLVE